MSASKLRSVPLFRPESVAYRADAVFGGILLPNPRWYAYLVWVVVCLVAAILAILCLGSYTKRSQAIGWVSSEPGPATILSPASGTLTSVYVQDGQAVEKGQPLFEIVRSESSSSQVSVETEVLEELRGERSNLLRVVGAEDGLAEDGIRAADLEIKTLKADITDLANAVRINESRLALAQAQFQRVETLASQGLLPKNALDSVQTTLLDAEAALNDRNLQLREKGRALNLRMIERSSVSLRKGQRVAELESRISALDRQLAQMQGDATTVVSAPVAGTVSGIMVSNGKSVTLGSRLVDVVPTGAIFRVELLVPSRDAGFLTEGMEVWMRFDAFPYQRYGQYRGTLKTIDLTVSPAGVSAGPVSLAEPAYRAIVALDRETISAYGRNVPLQSGMTLVAAISQGRRRIIDLALDPVNAARRSAY